MIGTEQAEFRETGGGCRGGVFWCHCEIVAALRADFTAEIGEVDRRTSLHAKAVIVRLMLTQPFGPELQTEQIVLRVNGVVGAEFIRIKISEGAFQTKSSLIER